MGNFRVRITVYVSVPVRTVLNVGKQSVSFQFWHDVKLLSFDINYFLLSFFDYLEHSWYRLECRNSRKCSQQSENND